MSRTGYSEPEDAYRFAKGEPIPLPPLDENGQGTRTVQLEHPLDFTAVTDHAEFFAEVEACVTPGSEAYDTSLCTLYREGTDDGMRVVENPTCRWSTFQCLGVPPEERPDTCTDPDIAKTIQERAWTSPIWYGP